MLLTSFQSPEFLLIWSWSFGILYTHTGSRSLNSSNKPIWTFIEIEVWIPKESGRSVKLIGFCVCYYMWVFGYRMFGDFGRTCFEGGMFTSLNILRMTLWKYSIVEHFLTSSSLPSLECSANPCLPSHFHIERDLCYYFSLKIIWFFNVIKHRFNGMWNDKFNAFFRIYQYGPGFIFNGFQ